MGIKKLIILSGGFDPLHSGHIELLKRSSEEFDYVVLCLNSDSWLKNKKGINFLSFEERRNILQSIKYVNQIVEFEEDEYGSAINGIQKVLDNFTSYRNILSDKTYLTDRKSTRLNSSH